MSRTPRLRSAVLGPVVVTFALLATAGCGDVEVTSDAEKSADASPDPSPSASSSAAVDTSAGNGSWLLAMSTAGGEDAETSTTTYVSYDPSTGQATATELPGVRAGSATPEQGVLLVSADRTWAIPDTDVSRAAGRSGKLKVYSLETGAPEVIDLAARTGRDDVEAIGWAFDPDRAATLRVVDTENRVWAVDVTGGRAEQEASLPKGPWVFLGGFNRTTGTPYVESIESSKTKPAGNGDADTSPITREGGVVLPGNSPALAKLPDNPCRFSAGFTESSGTTWVFCADSPSVRTYYLPEGAQEWTAYGEPSTAVAPPAAATFSLALPPTE